MGAGGQLGGQLEVVQAYWKTAAVFTCLYLLAESHMHFCNLRNELTSFFKKRISVAVLILKKQSMIK